jgi:hypothetical protein
MRPSITRSNSGRPSFSLNLPSASAFIPIDHTHQAILSPAMHTCVTGKSSQTGFLAQTLWRNCQIVMRLGSRFREEIASAHNAERR